MRGAKARHYRRIAEDQASTRLHSAVVSNVRTLDVPEDMRVVNPKLPQQITVTCITVVADRKRHYYQWLKSRRPGLIAQCPLMGARIQEARRA